MLIDIKVLLSWSAGSVGDAGGDSEAAVLE